MTLHFEQLRFYAGHGLYDQEKAIGNEFELNMVIAFNIEKDIVIDIDETINYATVYQLIKTEMQQPRELLETFLGELLQAIKQKFPAINYINATLYKLTVPIAGFKGRVGVGLEKRW